MNDLPLDNNLNKHIFDFLRQYVIPMKLYGIHLLDDQLLLIKAGTLSNFRANTFYLRKPEIVQDGQTTNTHQRHSPKERKLWNHRSPLRTYKKILLAEHDEWHKIFQ